MTTDNRTGDIRQELAAKLHEMFPGYIWNHYLNAADALALVAAQGAAPQAERDWRLDVVPEPWTTPAPVLPSSGVDEDKLAEVIAKSRGFGNGWAQIPPLTRGAYREVARAVAEWLNASTTRKEQEQ